MKFVEEFKKFAFKGNVVDMAVGVIVGGVAVRSASPDSASDRANPH